jgi:hypothetical protein
MNILYSAVNAAACRENAAAYTVVATVVDFFVYQQSKFVFSSCAKGGEAATCVGYVK